MYTSAAATMTATIMFCSMFFSLFARLCPAHRLQRAGDVPGQLVVEYEVAASYLDDLPAAAAVDNFDVRLRREPESVKARTLGVRTFYFGNLGPAPG